ncbi:MAG TPA: hypothetical protein PLE09_06685 [Caldisericia bacterium]|jgi:hypothetical protein|nr:hypothetical protein [Caldisericia bacterium]HXK52198.1 hypothetical protein [Caldisericia bacterium]
MHSVSYDTIVRHFTEERIAERYSFLEKKMNDFIEASGNEGIAECNPDILQHVIMDYFADIFRLKNFHFIDKVNIVKITAYTVAWIIRRKPIVLIKTLSEDNDKDIFLNERFCMSLIVNEVLYKDSEVPLNKEQMESVDEYIDLFLYFLMYRQCDPQSIELAMSSFLTGRITSK